MILRNGEQLLLTVVIPVLVLTVFSSIEVMDLGTRQRAHRLPRARRARAGRPVDGVHRAGHRHRVRAALRRAQAARRHSPAPLGAAGEQGAGGAADRGAADGAARARSPSRSGWSPHGSFVAVAVLMLAGTAAFSALALLMAGHAAGRGDAGRREPRLPALPGERRHRRAARPLPRQRPTGARGAAGRCAVGGSARGAARRCPARPGPMSAVLVGVGGGRGPADRSHLPLGVGTRAIPQQSRPSVGRAVGFRPWSCPPVCCPACVRGGRQRPRCAGRSSARW